MTNTADPKADAAFLAFHCANPRVLDIFVQVAKEKLNHCRQAGWKPRIGAKYIWEEMRWRLRVETNDAKYELNNTFLSRLVRLAVMRNPDLEECFETRKLKVKQHFT